MIAATNQSAAMKNQTVDRRIRRSISFSRRRSRKDTHIPRDSDKLESLALHRLASRQQIFRWRIPQDGYQKSHVACGQASG